MKFVILMSSPAEMERVRSALKMLNAKCSDAWVWTHDVNMVREITQTEEILLITSEVIHGVPDIGKTTYGTELARELKESCRTQFVLLYTCLRGSILGEPVSKQTCDAYVCKKDQGHVELVAAFMERVVTKQYQEAPCDSLARAKESTAKHEVPAQTAQGVWIQ